MNKSRQKELTRWLKQQSVISQRWLNISRLLGFVRRHIDSSSLVHGANSDIWVLENIPVKTLLLFPFYVTGFQPSTARMGGLVTRTGGLSRRHRIRLPSAVRFSTVSTSRASMD